MNTFNLNDVVTSLTNKLAAAELRASQYEALSISRQSKIDELEQKNQELAEKLNTKEANENK